MIFSPATTMSSILVNIQQNYGEMERVGTPEDTTWTLSCFLMLFSAF